jgi:hypothetical protein
MIQTFESTHAGGCGWRLFEENQLKGGFFPFQIDANAEPKFALNAPWCSNMSENQLLSVGTSFAHSTGGSI